MKTSGLILDVYDDVNGTTLRNAFGSPQDVPSSIKVAHSLTLEDRDRLPDDVFALVLREGEEVTRKFACVDQGNTELSVLYFLDNGHKLDPEAQVTTAENLKIACSWYGIEVPEELDKLAGLGSFLVNRAAKNPIGTAMTVMSAPSQVRGVKQQVKQNLQNVRAGEQATGSVIGGMGKVSEVVGTGTMPLSAPPKKGPVNSAPVVKTAMQQIVRDVAWTAPTQEKTASITALSDGRYPLDTYVEVKQAAAFFDSFADRMPLESRREFAVNLQKRASDLAIPTSEKIAHYGSTERASTDEWAYGYYTRSSNLQHRPEELALLDKVAAQRDQLDAESFSALLSEFDSLTGLNHYYGAGVADPIISSFSKEASLQGLNTSDDNFREVVKGTYVTAKHLADFALTHRREIDALFGSEFADKFQKDPVGEYKKLHDRRRVLIANLVTENAPGIGVTA